MQDGNPLILLGVHPYDMAAINQMDELFSQDEYDTHYMCRRKQITIIACDVVSPSKNVFASSMGTATVQHGYDMLLTDVGESFIVEVRTDKGRALMNHMPAARPASEAGGQAAPSGKEPARPEQARHGVQAVISAQAAGKNYDHPVWEEKAAVLLLRFVQSGLPDVLLL